LSGPADRPVHAVDWCDAFAYCAWAGKRLCGRIAGGSVDPTFGTDLASESEWYNACSRGGQHAYPYGDTYDPRACNGLEYGAGTGPQLPVGSLSSCTGGFAGLFDMSGNVSEWEDS